MTPELTQSLTDAGYVGDYSTDSLITHLGDNFKELKQDAEGNWVAFTSKVCVHNCCGMHSITNPFGSGATREEALGNAIVQHAD